jgi:ribonuclease Z
MRPILHPRLVNGVFGDPALYIDLLFEKRSILFDLGDIQALSPREILRLSDVFVSHTHVDHFIGFDWLLRLCLGREKTVRMFGPPRFIQQVQSKLAAYTWNLVENYEADLTLIVTEVHPSEPARTVWLRCRNAFNAEQAASTVTGNVLIDEPLFRVRYTALDHKIPCLAFVLEEAAHVNIWKNKLPELGLEVGPWLRELKHAVLKGEPDERPFRAWWREGGRLRERWIPLGELKERVLKIVPGQKIAYVTDVVFHEENAERIVELARGADILVIEAVFLDEERARATEKFHLTAAQAGMLARRAGVKQIVPFHFSPRYQDAEDRLRSEVTSAFRGG